MRRQDDYQVKLSHFEGPLDLLLHLVRRAEVDIHDIPIHRITDEYLAFLKEIDSIEVDVASEFLVMAATLVEIKSRTLAPAGNTDGDTDVPLAGDMADPRHELVRQLVAYQRFRTACDTLQRIREEFAQRYPVGRRASAADGAQPPDSAADDEASLAADLEDIHILDLLAAYEKIVAAIDFTRMGDHRVEYDDTPISLHEEDIVDRLKRDPTRGMTMRAIFEGRSRGEMLGLFLALLELARQQRVRVEQEGDGDIRLALADGAEGSTTAASATAASASASGAASAPSASPTA